MFSTPFVAVGGEAADINSVLSSDDLPSGSVLSFWENGAYNYATYYGVDADGGVYTDNTYETCLGAGWGDGEQVAIVKEMNPGFGYWLQSEDSASVTYAGEVNTNKVTVSISSGLNQVGNAFPGSISLSKITSSDLPSGSVISFWDNATATYTFATYYGVDADGGVYTDNSYETCLGAGWGDGEQVVITKTIDTAEGFWLQSEDSASLEIEF